MSTRRSSSRLAEQSKSSTGMRQARPVSENVDTSNRNSVTASRRKGRAAPSPVSNVGSRSARRGLDSRFAAADDGEDRSHSPAASSNDPDQDPDNQEEDNDATDNNNVEAAEPFDRFDKSHDPLTPAHPYETRHATNMHSLADVVTAVLSIVRMKAAKRANTPHAAQAKEIFQRSRRYSLADRVRRGLTSFADAQASIMTAVGLRSNTAGDSNAAPAASGSEPASINDDHGGDFISHDQGEDIVPFANRPTLPRGERDSGSNNKAVHSKSFASAVSESLFTYVIPVVVFALIVGSIWSLLLSIPSHQSSLAADTLLAELNIDNGRTSTNIDSGSGMAGSLDDSTANELRQQIKTLGQRLVSLQVEQQNQAKMSLNIKSSIGGIHGDHDMLKKAIDSKLEAKALALEEIRLRLKSLVSSGDLEEVRGKVEEHGATLTNLSDAIGKIPSHFHNELNTFIGSRFSPVASLVESLASSGEAASRDVKAVAEEIGILRGALLRLEESIKAVGGENASLTASLREVKSLEEQLAVRLEGHKGSIASTVERLAALEGGEGRVKERVRVIEDRIAALGAEKDRASAVAKGAGANGNPALSQELQELNNKIAALVLEKNILVSDGKDARSSLSSVKDQLQSLTSDVKSNTRKFDELDSIRSEVKRLSVVESRLVELDRKVASFEDEVTKTLARMKAAAATPAPAPAPVTVTAGEIPQAKVKAWVAEAVKEWATTQAQSQSQKGGKGTGLSVSEVSQMIEDAIETYSADKVGKADYALHRAGGVVIDHSSGFYPSEVTLWDSLIGWLDLRHVMEDVSIVTKSDATLGKCWAMEGSSGFVTIKLRKPIVPKSFSIDHVSRLVAYDASTAPRKFEVYGLRNRHDSSPVLLGGPFEYDREGLQVQTFPASGNAHGDSVNTDTEFSIVQFRFLENWGHNKYTCIYRLRVHNE